MKLDKKKINKILFSSSASVKHIKKKFMVNTKNLLFKRQNLTLKIFYLNYLKMIKRKLL